MREEAVLDPDTMQRERDAGLPPAGMVETTGGAPEPDPGAGSKQPSARRRLVIVEVVSAVVIVLLVAALVVSRVQLSDQNALNADRTSAVAAAKSYAIDVATYSYRHLPRDFGRVEEESTAGFRRSFIESSAGLSKVLVQYKATASAKVLAAGVSSISASKAVVLLFVNQSVANSTQQGVSTDDSRIELTLVRAGGDRWLLQDLKLIG